MAPNYIYLVSFLSAETLYKNNSALHYKAPTSVKVWVGGNGSRKLCTRVQRLLVFFWECDSPAFRLTARSILISFKLKSRNVRENKSNSFAPITRHDFFIASVRRLITFDAPHDKSARLVWRDLSPLAVDQPRLSTSYLARQTPCVFASARASRNRRHQWAVNFSFLNLGFLSWLVDALVHFATALEYPCILFFLLTELSFDITARGWWGLPAPTIWDHCHALAKCTETTTSTVTTCAHAPHTAHSQAYNPAYPGPIASHFEIASRFAPTTHQALGTIISSNFNDFPRALLRSHHNHMHDTDTHTH